VGFRTFHSTKTARNDWIKDTVVTIMHHAATHDNDRFLTAALDILIVPGTPGTFISREIKEVKDH
jgi:hypothetical protein